MITNETRAKLIGRTPTFFCGPEGLMPDETPFYPSYPTDANAVAELRAFVRARGKMREFVDALINELHDEWRREDRDNRTGFTGTGFDLIDATPAQQTKAFDTVFADDLEKL